MNRIAPSRLVLGAAVVAAVACATAAVASSERPRGVASLGSEGGRDLRIGLTLEAEAPESSLRRISVRFVKGAEVSLKRREKAYDYAVYWLGHTRDTKEFGGRLQVPAGKAGGRFKLRFRNPRGDFTQPAPVTAMLRTGRRPSLVITGLPPDTQVFELNTVGAGDRGTRATFCEDERVRYRGRMRFVLESGDRVRGDASGSFVCRDLPPRRCVC
jgi:hypothetical protein